VRRAIRVECRGAPRDRFQGFITTTAATNRTVSSLGSATNNSGVLTQNDINNALQDAFTNGADPELVFVSPAIKRQISAFTVTQQNRNIAAIEKKLVNSVDFYLSDFGMIQLILDRWVPQAASTSTATAQANGRLGNIFFLERAKNRPRMVTADGSHAHREARRQCRRSILGEVTLEVLSERANYRINRVM